VNTSKFETELFFRRKREGRKNKSDKFGARSILVPFHGMLPPQHTINNNN